MEAGKTKIVTPIPLFVCHANCCRSVLAKYLYEHLCPGSVALSAGIEVGEQINNRAEDMLFLWGIKALNHIPQKINQSLCDQSNAIFFMSPLFLQRFLKEYGFDLPHKSYLFADPFTLPFSFSNGEYHVHDPSFDDRPTEHLNLEYQWFTERVVQIHHALQNDGEKLVPAIRYLNTLNKDVILDQ